MSETQQLSSNFAYHTGRMLGRYQLSNLIARGGMAEVYKSYHPELERDLAVKILYPHFTDMPGFVARFRREAQAAAALRHPNIVQIFDFARTEDGLYYMVLEYIDGQSMESFLEAQAPLTLSQTLALFRQIASATQYAHEHGLVHRDIKPANILLDKHGQAYLTDFGIAHIMGMSRLTQTDTKAGTPVYMAPEQIENQPVNVTADVYSLGMLLYKMLTNRVPYENDNPSLVMMQKLMKPPISPRLFQPDLPAEVEEILLTALAHEPESRFPDVVSMTWALEDAYGAVPEGVLTDTVVTQMSPQLSDLPLNRLDHYEIQEPLPHSETGLSQRYVAYNQMLDELAILEVPKIADDESKALFLQRMTAVSQLDHPHVAVVNFINQTDDGYSFAALAYQPGMSLAARMKAGTMTRLVALHLARQIINALETIHAINLVHGDLRPETIFVGEGERIWLMGLGDMAGKPTIHQNIQTFGRLLQHMLPEEELTPAQPTASIITNCLAAGVTGYDSMAAVRVALDEALAIELDQPETQPARPKQSYMLIAGGIVLVLILLTAFVIWRLRLETTTDLPLSTPEPTLALEDMTIQRAATADTSSLTNTSMAPESALFNANLESGDIHLVAIVYNPAGDDADGEYVVMENRGSEAIDLSNWLLEDGADRAHLYNFPSFTLPAGAQVKLWTGRGANSETELYWGSGSPIWNNDGDTASLYDDRGMLVDQCIYRGGGETADCE